MLRVLVVDDKLEAVELLKEFLLGRGYGVLTASDGEEALPYSFLDSGNRRGVQSRP